MHCFSASPRYCTQRDGARMNPPKAGPSSGYLVRPLLGEDSLLGLHELLLRSHVTDCEAPVGTNSRNTASTKRKSKNKKKGNDDTEYTLWISGHEAVHPVSFPPGKLHRTYKHEHVFDSPPSPNSLSRNEATCDVVNMASQLPVFFERRAESPLCQRRKISGGPRR